MLHNSLSTLFADKINLNIYTNKELSVVLWLMIPCFLLLIIDLLHLLKIFLFQVSQNALSNVIYYRGEKR